MNTATKVTNLEVIFDNGGGVTVQCDGYAHYYQHDASAAAVDFKSLLDGADPADWDGNDEDAETYPTDDEINNGGYQVFSAEEVSELIDDREVQTQSNNVAAFFRALGCEIID